MKKLISLLLVLLLSISCVLLTACVDEQNYKDPTRNVDNTESEINDGTYKDPTGNVDNTESEINDGTYKDPTDNIVKTASQDKYRNYYHIWVCSFNDSNADETGDLQGIIDKLDYINDGNSETDTDLGLDGIWLSPIMPSDSYHKYDVDDYMDIDPEFGDLETFDKLIEECDKRGIVVILDLVLNHCGTGHEYWKQAFTEAKAGKLDGYAQYFRFQNGLPGVEGWRQVIGTPDLWYEGQFSGEMPEWNLEYEGTRTYFEEVAKFWLERGVAGFRLDAVKYMDDGITDGNEFLNWFYTTAQKYNPDVYMVGENWQGNSYLYDTYESGIDSQFAFSFGTASGNFATSVNSGNGIQLSTQLKKFDDNSVEANDKVIHAMFLSNHDMVRSGNYFSRGLSFQKMATAAYMLAPGNTFTYYGEEIGLEVPAGRQGNDAYFRGAMIWDDTVEPDIWCTADAYSDCPYGGVAQQTDDENSLMSFYRRVVKIKNQNPEIARGRITEAYTLDEKAICAYKVEYQGKSLLIIHNMDEENSHTMEITADMMENPIIRGDLYAQTADFPTGDRDTSVPIYASLSNGTLVLPAQSSVVIGCGE